MLGHLQSLQNHCLKVLLVLRKGRGLTTFVAVKVCLAMKTLLKVISMGRSFQIKILSYYVGQVLGQRLSLFILWISKGLIKLVPNEMQCKMACAWEVIYSHWFGFVVIVNSGSGMSKWEHSSPSLTSKLHPYLSIFVTPKAATETLNFSCLQWILSISCINTLVKFSLSVIAC